MHVLIYVPMSVEEQCFILSIYDEMKGLELNHGIAALPEIIHWNVLKWESDNYHNYQEGPILGSVLVFDGYTEGELIILMGNQLDSKVFFNSSTNIEPENLQKCYQI